MIDIAPNLCSEQFDKDWKEVLKKAEQAGMKAMILTSTDKKSYEKNLFIIENNPTNIQLKTTYGLHPHHAQHHSGIFENLKQAMLQPHIVSIGEFGLDYFRMISPQNTQVDVMEKFLYAAREHKNKSLFLHERSAFEDFLSILKKHRPDNHKVVHCFTGNREQAKAYIDENCFIGITGWISDKRRNEELVEAVRYIPLEFLMIETDCPYLTPFNIHPRPRRNEPSLLSYVAMSIAEIKNVSFEEVLDKTTENALDFFQLNRYNDINTINNMVKLK